MLRVCLAMAVAHASSETAHRPFIIGVCGGTASGKSTVCEYIATHLAGEDVGIVPSDSFYRPLTTEEKERAYRSDFNFDAPDAIDFDGLKTVVRSLRGHQDVELPVYDFATHSRKSITEPFPRRQVVIVEGILIFNDPQLLDMFDLKVFVECDADVRLARRVQRDITERGRALNGVFEQYFRFVKPSYDTFVEPAKRYADVIIPNASSTGVNMIAIDVLCKHIQAQLAIRA